MNEFTGEMKQYGNKNKHRLHILYYIRNLLDATLAVLFIITVRILYMFRTFTASIIRST